MSRKGFTTRTLRFRSAHLVGHLARLVSGRRAASVVYGPGITFLWLGVSFAAGCLVAGRRLTPVGIPPERVGSPADGQPAGWGRAG